MSRIYPGHLVPLDARGVPTLTRDQTGALAGVQVPEPVAVEAVPLPEYVAADPVAAPQPPRPPSVVAWKPAARPVNPPAVAVHPPGNSFNDVMRAQATPGAISGPAIVPRVRLRGVSAAPTGFRSGADV